MKPSWGLHSSVGGPGKQIANVEISQERMLDLLMRF